MEGSTTSHPPYCPSSFSPLLAWNDSLLQNTSLAAMSWQSWVKHKTDHSDQQEMLFSSKNTPHWSENMWLGFGCGSQFSSWATTMAQVSLDHDSCLVWWLPKLECYQTRSAWIWFGEIHLCICICIRVCIWIDWRRWGARGCGRAVKSSRVSSTAATPSESNEHTTSFGAKIVIAFVFVVPLHQICICAASSCIMITSSSLWNQILNHVVLCPNASTVQEILFCQLWLLASFSIFGIFW